MFSQVIAILFPVMALAVVGYLLAVWFKPDFRPLNKMNLVAFTPALVFSSLLHMKLDMSQLPLIGASLIAVLLPGLLMIPICHWGNWQYKTWAPLHMFRNSGNLAIPIFTYTFGPQAMPAAVMLMVVSTCLQVSVGQSILKKSASVAQVFVSPLFLSAVLAIAINLSGVTVWEPLYQASDLLGQACIPIMLLSLGSQMTNMQLSGLKIGIISTLQSLATGFVAFALIYWLIPLPAMQMQMMVLFTMLPPAVMNYLFAEQCQVEPTKVASMVLFGNFFAIVTLPALLVFAFSLPNS
ncbi:MULTISPECIES: AEC family transporter [Vibrio]|uniref:AEC family transporter n=2 Tax=Vibrio TaxID=662 RepID=A0A7X4RVQ6_9VIBR|nr:MULTISPECIES: AEC family transporter [Vibrio]MBF9000131.1 AEC family transporter [Vibrio nitrifigilis]MZI94374.1 AEC family transporter [Vibrio eleionomae]